MFRPNGPDLHTTRRSPRPDNRSQRPRRPPPNQRVKDIEAARRRTRELYHVPDPDPSLNGWYTTPSTSINPLVTPRMAELCRDYEQTMRHHETFTAAKSSSTGDEELQEVYERVATLYKERVSYIHLCGTKRAGLWTCFFEELHKSNEYRNDDFIAACNTTLRFHEHDYVWRKLDFVTEIYALLETHDPTSAQMVLRDLEEMWPWTKPDFTMRLTHLVANYDAVPLANHHVNREPPENAWCYDVCNSICWCYDDPVNGAAALAGVDVVQVLEKHRKGEMDIGGRGSDYEGGEWSGWGDRDRVEMYQSRLCPRDCDGGTGCRKRGDAA